MRSAVLPGGKTVGIDHFNARKAANPLADWFINAAMPDLNGMFPAHVPQHAASNISRCLISSAAGDHSASSGKPARRVRRHIRQEPIGQYEVGFAGDRPQTPTIRHDEWTIREQVGQSFGRHVRPRSEDIGALARIAAPCLAHNGAMSEHPALRAVSSFSIRPAESEPVARTGANHFHATVTTTSPVAPKIPPPNVAVNGSNSMDSAVAEIAVPLILKPAVGQYDKMNSLPAKRMLHFKFAIGVAVWSPVWFPSGTATCSTGPALNSPARGTWIGLVLALPEQGPELQQLPADGFPWQALKITPLAVLTTTRPEPERNITQAHRSIGTPAMLLFGIGTLVAHQLLPEMEARIPFVGLFGVEGQAFNPEPQGETVTRTKYPPSKKCSSSS